MQKTEGFETILGVLAALVWAAIGYTVAKAKSDEDFNTTKFGKTLIIGFLLGLITWATGYDVETIESFGLLQVIIVVVDKLTAPFFKETPEVTPEEPD